MTLASPMGAARPATTPEVMMIDDERARAEKRKSDDPESPGDTALRQRLVALQSPGCADPSASPQESAGDDEGDGVTDPNQVSASGPSAAHVPVGAGPDGAAAPCVSTVHTHSQPLQGGKQPMATEPNAATLRRKIAIIIAIKIIPCILR